jgi:site-specific DNA-methyltransferase (adenine-specific)
MISLPNATVYHGSNLDVLPTLPDNSVDSIVTDPPYELGFMGKSWDNSGIAYSVELWTECMRVLKPGGHLLAFGGSRTWHRLAVAIEDAGFEMRDSIAWLYGSGFPKSMDVAKAIDKQSGFDGDVIGTETVDVGMQGGSMHAGRETKLAEREIKELSPEAQKWQGWGTALKPAFEPVVVARKPLGEKTVAANVLAYGTGGLNIDASRIGYQGEKPSTWFDQQERKNQNIPFGSTADTTEPSSLGRWPANIILDPYTAELLDEQSGISKSNGPGTHCSNRDINGVCVGHNNAGRSTSGATYHAAESNKQPDSGGASRFFYVAKASKKDRNEGLEELEGKEIGAKGNGLARACATCGATVLDGCDCPGRTFVNPTRQNFHPTVKPTSLMEYLIKLVTPEGGTVLDPFTGSGSTGKAALINGYQFIGIELTDEYLPIIEGRLKWANEQASKKEEEKNEVLF